MSIVKVSNPIYVDHVEKKRETKGKRSADRMTEDSFGYDVSRSGTLTRKNCQTIKKRIQSI